MIVMGHLDMVRPSVLAEPFQRKIKLKNRQEKSILEPCPVEKIALENVMFR